MYDVNKDVGKTIWSRNKAERGKILRISHRYCAACGGDHSCYIVQWSDGTTTKPCTAGVGFDADSDDLIIL